MYPLGSHRGEMLWINYCVRRNLTEDRTRRGGPVGLGQEPAARGPRGPPSRAQQGHGGRHMPGRIPAITWLWF